MTSFRVRLALLVGFSTAAMLLAAAFLAWNFTSDLNVERPERGVQSSPMTRIGDPSEVGAGRVLQVALEALHVQFGREVPRQEGGGEQHRGRGKPDEQGESDPERSHAPARWEAGTARAR